MKIFKKKVKKSGIAFGGGGTRGIVHIGAIRVFQENNIEFDYVSGNSAGSIAGALYAAKIPWEQIYDYVLDIKNKSVLARKTLLSYISPDIVEKAADYFLNGKKFNDLETPFCAVAVNLEEGSLETLCKGSVAKALSASCAVPGVFQPVTIGKKTYIDGGTLRSIPTQTVRDMGAETVVGINLNADRSRGTKSKRRLNVFLTAYNLSININSQLCEKYADIMLKPRLDTYSRHNFKSIESMLKIGEKTAKENLENILELIS